MAGLLAVPQLVKLATNPLAWVGVGFAGVLIFAGIQSARLNHAKHDLASALTVVQSYKDAERAAQAHAAQVNTSSAAITQSASTATAATVERLHTVYVTVTKEIPSAIPPAADAYLPVGWVRVHDLAARADMPVVPPSAREPDGSPSDVKSSEALGVVVANYSGCAADRARLTALQGWLTDQEAVFANQTERP